MAATNVQAFSGDVEVASNLAVDTNVLFVDSVNNKVGIGVTNPSNSFHIYKDDTVANNDQTSGLLIEKVQNGTGAAALFFGVMDAAESPGVPKAAIFYERNLANGRGDLKFCNDAANDTGAVTGAADNTRMIIKNNGNVGIGTNSPGQMLTLYTGSTSKAGLSINRYPTGNYRTEFYQVVDGLAIYVGHSSAPTEKVRIKHDGKVGIGTNNPDETLEVAGNAKIHSVYRETFTGSGGTGSYIYLGRFNTQANGIVEISSAGNSQYNTNKFEFQRQYDSTPHVSGIDSDHYLNHRFFFKSVDVYQYDLWHYRDGNDWSTPVGGYTYRVQSHVYSKPSAPAASGLTECVYGVRVCNEPGDTRLGIGVIRAFAKVHIRTNGDGYRAEQTNTSYYSVVHGGSMFINNPSTSGGYEHFIMNNDANGSHTTTYFSFRRSNGQIGSILTNNGSFITFNTGSDYRLKENIVPMSNVGLEVINKLQPKVFNFKNYPNQSVHGFIAHELQEHIPIAVSGEKDAMIEKGNIVKIDDESVVIRKNVSKPDNLDEGTKWIKVGEEPEYQGVDLSKTVPWLVKAIQEISEEIQTLKTRLDALESA